MSSSNVYKRNADVLTANVDGELVMMSVQAGSYFSIGGIGTQLWELLAEPKSLDALIDAIVADYDVPRERCAADVGVFLQKLIDLNLIESS